MVKKIGIITFHRAYNYGSALQAYALNKYLRNLGCEVETIDYCSHKQQELYKLYEPNRRIIGLARNMQTYWYEKKLISKKKDLIHLY